MTGKSYSIREMKTIVEYLTENKLYSEIRGRKMWMDFANSKLTTRTWQSLKETFLKRILPDIHNPYYKLNMEQINSFRAGYDVGDRNKNTLEIHTVSDDSNSNGPTQNVTAQSNNGNGIKEEKTAGENIKPSKIPSRNRSSADTVTVETCYETAEDIQKDLESPTRDNENRGTKSLRDCITYSEPLTPMLQEVLDDFQSEPENDPDVSEMEAVQSEPTETSENVQQEISENTENDQSNKDANVNPGKDTELVSSKVSEEIVDGKKSNNEEAGQEVQDADTDKDVDVLYLDDSPAEDNVELNNVENDTHKETNNDVNKTDEMTATKHPENTEIVEVHDSSENPGPIANSGAIPNSNSTTDTTLPNNPEALKKRISDENQADKPATPEKKIGNKLSRKRSNSEHIMKATESKKTKLEKNKKKALSETEGRKEDDTAVNIKSKDVEPKGETKKEESISNNKEETNSNKIAPNLSSILEKPSTSLADDVNQILLTSDTDQGENVNESSEIQNPCLQNLSLFEEQLNKEKYKISESSDAEQKNKNDVVAEKNKKNELKEEQNQDKENEVVKLQEQEKEKEVVQLQSHTESDTEELPPPKKKHRAAVATTKKDRALANVFGFASGLSQSKRQKQLSRRRRTISQNNISHNNGASGSSEWTSESDSDMYVPPPRGRKNRHTRKYLKPQSGRIFSLEEEGGLFVMYGKKIYPLVKDGKLVKNYLHYLPESDSEDEKSYWKSKYVEEKKKAEELKKLLERAKEEPQAGNSASTSAQLNPLRNSTSNQNQAQGVPTKEICLADEKVVKSSAPESIKIKFTTKNDQEIHLEGNWPQIHNVLEHVVHIFQKEPQLTSEYKPPQAPAVEPPSSSGLSTPVVITAVHEPNLDPEIREKVAKIESEIFKEIEDRDKEEQQPSSNGQVNNVTKRKVGRPRKSSQSSVAQSPAKRQKIMEQQDSEVNSTNTKTTGDNENVGSEANKRQSRTRSTLNESPSSNDTKVIQTRRSKLNTSIDDKGNEDEEVRYMFPPRNKRQSLKTATEKNTRDKPQKSTTKVPKIFSSPETICPNSVESTLGYPDSDPSPMKTGLRKKKLMNLSTIRSRSNSHSRRSSRKNIQKLPYLYCDYATDSSADGPIQTIERDNSTLNTEVYRSESYQLLMAQKKASLRQLEQINEASPITNEVDFIQHLDSTNKNEVFSVQMTTNYDKDIGSSSNVSLPVSPEFSIVENMSVSKESLLAFEGRVVKEIPSDETKEPASCSQFFMSNIDASVPLMQQDCGLESCNLRNETNPENVKSTVTESLLSKIGTFNIEDPTNLTDSLDVKLRDLLLESAKKMSIDNLKHKETNDNMDIDVEVKSKVNSKKRCSTPRKRKNSQKSKKIPNVQTVIEEEHTESYSKGGRKSCPPVVQSSAREDNILVDDINITALTIDENVKSKARKKKDIIKVKILRPKPRKSHNNTTKLAKKSITSVCTDSGINDTESGAFHAVNESVDLIHNHSETCLHANECVGDSVEFVENSKSVVTLGDSTQSDYNLWDSQYEFNDAEDYPPDLFCNNAQDVRSFYHKQVDGENTSETVYHSPVCTEISSLITEDLSDDLPQVPGNLNKWYLLSEEETVNNNSATNPATASCGAQLTQIFPLTYAIPDLSTITERSRENDEDSRRPTLESLTGDCFNSPSILN